jgi:YHS domain-containing protein
MRRLPAGPTLARGALTGDQIMNIRALAAATLFALVPAACTSVRPVPASMGSMSPPVLVNRDHTGLALQGYDPVAYFTDARPVMGDPRFTSRHRGATYRFASAEHKAMFDTDPARYEPAFGGYCGYAASINRLSPISPEYWQVIDGRLVLQHNQRALDAWNKDVPANLRKADANWPGLVERNARPEKVLVNVNDAGVAILGHDPVAYFTDARPVMGQPKYAAVYNGATYWFASMEHRVTFENDPARYEPQFGGYCGYAASINKLSPIDPRFWQIIDGRLVLQHTQKAYDLFNADARASLARADANWPALVDRNGK